MKNKNLSNVCVNEDGDLCFDLAKELSSSPDLEVALVASIRDEIKNNSKVNFLINPIITADYIWNVVLLAKKLNEKRFLDYLYVPIHIQKKVELVVDRNFYDGMLKVLDNWFQEFKTRYLSFRTNNDSERHVILDGNNDIKKILLELDGLDAFSIAEFTPCDFSHISQQI